MDRRRSPHRISPASLLLLILIIGVGACTAEEANGAFPEAIPSPTATEGAPEPPAAEQRPPRSGDFPDETTTGVPEGTQLAQSKSVTSSRDGEVIENLEITGAITVLHNDVTIRNVRVRGTGIYGISVPHELSGQVSGLLIEDTEVIGVDGRRSAGIAPYGAWTARRVDISGFEDGIKLGSNQTLEDSWIHDLYTPPGSHSDGVQSAGGSDVVIRGNRIEGNWQSQTSAIIIQSNFSPIERYTIEGNLLSGGTYTLYLRDKRAGHGAPRDIVVRDNTWITDSWAFGPLSTDQGPGWVWENNHLDDGTPVN